MNRTAVKGRVINVATFLLLVAFLLVSFPGLARGESVDETKAASADGFVGINVVRGDVDIKGWDESSIRVVGTLDEKVKDFVFDVRGNETEIRVRIGDRDSGWFGDYGSDLTIYVPADSQVEFTGVSTDVNVRDVRNSLEVGVVSGELYLEGDIKRVDLQTVSGDVELRKTPGRIRVKTVSGDVESLDASGDAVYSTVSGNIVIENGGPELRLETVSGDIEVERSVITNLGGHSVSGDISISADTTRDASIEFDSMSGTIRLRLSGDVNARFDIETGSGSIRNRISDDKPKVSRYMGDETLRFTLGDGDGQVVLTTQSGDISISGR